MSRIVTLEEGTQWPNPDSEWFGEVAWSLRHVRREAISREILHYAASVMAAYGDLLTHPAFTQKVVMEKVRGIRHAMLAQREKQ